MLEKWEKWDSCNFTDFDGDLPIFQVYQPTIDTIINMAVYLCTFLIKPFKNAKCVGAIRLNFGLKIKRLPNVLKIAPIHLQ